MNADEIVGRLREYAKRCDGVHACWNEPTLTAAADLIESLQAQLAEYKATGLTPGDVKDLQGLCKENGLAEYVDIIVEAKRLLSRNNEQSIEQDERIERLEAQLAESQRRAQAAVQDFEEYMLDSDDTPCGYCAHYAADKTCHPIKGPCNPKWKGRRGPQEAGKGESNDQTL